MPRERRVREPGELSRMVKRPASLKLNRNPDRAPTSETLKASVLAALVLGQPAAQIAHQFGLPVASVRRWKENFDISDPIKRRDHLSEMLMVFLEQEIASLMTISMVTQDEEWIKEQSATELATYVSVKQDRLMAVLSAFGKAQAQREYIAGEIVDASD